MNLHDRDLIVKQKEKDQKIIRKLNKALKQNAATAGRGETTRNNNLSLACKIYELLRYKKQVFRQK